MAKKKTSFADWISAYGVPNVAALCKVTPRTVYYWKSGKVKPSDDACKKILEVAPHLHLADIRGISI